MTSCNLQIPSDHLYVKSADPSRRVVEVTLCKIQTFHKIQNPKSKIQNAESKRPRLGLPQKERILPQSKIQNPRSKIQDPKTKIQTARLDFGFGMWSGPGNSHVANEAVFWPSWQATKLATERREAWFHARVCQIGADFQRMVLLETELRFPAPCHGNRPPVSRETVDGCGVAKGPF